MFWFWSSADGSVQSLDVCQQNYDLIVFFLKLLEEPRRLERGQTMLSLLLMSPESGPVSVESNTGGPLRDFGLRSGPFVTGGAHQRRVRIYGPRL